MPFESEYFMIEYGDMPCVYELSWDGRTPAIILRIHRDFVDNCLVVPQDSPIVLQFMEQFGFSSCSRALNGETFGFEGAFQRAGEEGEFSVFRIPIPVVKKQSAEACHRCEGTKKDQHRDGEDCLMCEGTGKEHEMDWEKAYSISASFTLFFTMVSARSKKQEKTSCKFPQLIEIDTVTIQDSHGGSLGEVYGIPLVKFLSSFPEGTEMLEMKQAMEGAWGTMFGRVKDYDSHSFWARVDYKGGWLNVSCPGDACGLHPSDGSMRKDGGGYKFSCHNVDTPMQQLTLLAGLAALCDRVRKEKPV